MKKVLTIAVTLFLLLGSAAFAVDDFYALKFGYGNQTAGTGIAYEAKADMLGFYVGTGKFNENVGFSTGLKIYGDVNSNGGFYLGGSYGVLGTEWASWDGEVKTLYGPFASFGYTLLADSGFYLDASFGYGTVTNSEYFSDFNYPTAQISIGYGARQWNSEE